MIWTITYWVFLIFAITAALYAIFWDRPGWKGRPKFRCKKCWYDLTASTGDLRIEPIQCPECGKKHPTQRSMQKIKRHRKLLLVAITLWLAAYGAQITPKVQKQGWAAAVPDVVLVASFPFLSEERGTGLSSFILPAKHGLTPTKFEAFVLKRVGGVMSSWVPNTRGNQFSWLSKRLVFILARFESSEVLTDPTTVKGHAYASFITRVVRMENAFEFESKWAHSIIYFEFDTGADPAPDTVLYASFRSRRLLKGQYRLGLGWRRDEFICNTPTTMWINGGHPATFTKEEAINYWVNRFSWDSHYLVTKSGEMRYSENGSRYAMGVSSKNTLGTQTNKVRYLIEESKNNKRDSASFREVAKGETLISYQVDQNQTIIEDSSQELKDFIKEKLNAKFTVKYDRVRNQWIPVVKLSSRDVFAIQQDPITEDEKESMANGGDFPQRLFEQKQRIPPLLEGGMIFGGRVSINIIWDLDGTPYEYTLMSGSETWWRWGTPDYAALNVLPPPREAQESRIILRPVSQNPETIPGEVQRGSSTPAKYRNKSYQVVIKIEPAILATWPDFGGLWAHRVYTGTIEFPINRWKVDELRNFIVNGTVPDHAMP